MIKLFISALLIYAHTTILAQESEVAVWANSDFPILMVLDNQNAPLGLSNSILVKQELISSSYQWNQNPSFGTFLNIIEGSVDINCVSLFE